MRNLTAILTVFSVSCMGACIGGCSGASGDTDELFNEPSADASSSETFGFNADAGGADGFIGATGTCRTDTDCNDGDQVHA